MSPIRSLLVSSLCALSGLALAGDFSPYVDAEGNISRPTDIRTDFVHLGSWAVLDEGSDAHGLHDVYTERRSVEHYRRTGAFPDGATLIKEIRTLESAGLTTGNPVVWGDQPAVWFVMVKDSRQRFPDHPLWGDGWGWALYKADAPSRNVASSYRKDCMACHVPAKATDRVFVQGYPTLRAAE